MSWSVCPYARHSSLPSKQWCRYTFSLKSPIKVEPRIASNRRGLSLLILVLDLNLISCPEYLKRFSDIVTRNCKWLSQKYRANILLVSFGFFPSFFFFFTFVLLFDLTYFPFLTLRISFIISAREKWFIDKANVLTLPYSTDMSQTVVILFFAFLAYVQGSPVSIKYVSPSLPFSLFNRHGSDSGAK